MLSVITVETMARDNVNVNANMLEEASVEEQIEALKTLFTVFYIKYHVDGNEEDKLRVWSIINKWVSIVGPVKHEPRILDAVSQIVKFSIWDKPLPVDLIEDIIDKSVKLREANDFEDFSKSLSELLMYLNGSSESRDLVKEVCLVDADCLLTIAVQALVIASNI